MWWMLRHGPDREPLPVAMSGVRPGERVLQINVDDPQVVAGLAAKVGVTGDAAVVVASERDVARVRGVGVEADGLSVTVTPFDALPFDDAAFDVVVVHGAGGLVATLERATWMATLRESHRVLRPGGRIVTVEPGRRSGLGARLRSAPPVDAAYEEAGGTMAALGSAGFQPVRLLADRDGTRFFEGIRPT